MDLFDNIYDLTYLPLVTPYNLIDNLKLKNYYGINFNKNDDCILAEVTCEIDKKTLVFNYLFDKNNFLQKIYYYENDEINILFNRSEKLDYLKNEFKKDIKNIG